MVWLCCLKDFLSRFSCKRFVYSAKMRSSPIYDTLSIFQCFQHVAHFYIVMDACQRMLIGLNCCASHVQVVCWRPSPKIKRFCCGWEFCLSKFVKMSLLGNVLEMNVTFGFNGQTLNQCLMLMSFLLWSCCQVYDLCARPNIFSAFTVVTFCHILNYSKSTLIITLN